MTADTHATTEREVAQLMVDALHLEVAPQEIRPDEPLFGEGLGLDSIDALEIALAISRTYGVELKSDDDQRTAGLRVAAQSDPLHRHASNKMMRSNG